MKKRMILLLFVLVLGVCATGYYSFTLKHKLENVETELQNEKTNYPEIYDVINSITYENFAGKMNGKETFTVYVGRPTCSDCTDFEPEFIELIKEHGLSQDIYYLNTAQVRKDDAEWESFKERYEISYTPTIATIEEGKIVSMAGWTPENGIDMDEIDLFLKECRLEK